MGNPCLKGTTYSNPTLSSPPPSTSAGNSYCATTKGTQIDNYALANLNNITLRLGSLTSAITTLTNLATSTASSGQFATPPVYQFAAYTTNTLWNIPSGVNQLMAMTSNYVSGWTTASANFGPMEMYDNNNSCANSACSSINSSGPGDADTNYDTAMNGINTTMPTPGNGTNLRGDTPQEVLFFVTDGVEDENNPGRIIQQINAGSSTNYCSEIKARGIKIAILYTEYLPVTVNSYYDQHVEPISTRPRPGAAGLRVAWPVLRCGARYRPRRRFDHPVSSRRSERHTHTLTTRGGSRSRYSHLSDVSAQARTKSASVFRDCRREHRTAAAANPGWWTALGPRERSAAISLTSRDSESAHGRKTYFEAVGRHEPARCYWPQFIVSREAFRGARTSPSLKVMALTACMIWRGWNVY